MAIRKEKNRFDKFNEWVMNVELSIITLIATIIPWMTPVAPAVMTFKHAVETLDFHWIVAGIIAGTVEALGFAALYLTVTFIMFNKKNKAKYKAAPTWAVAFAFVFYLAIIVVSNVLLDAFKGTEYMPWVIIAVKALFTLMAIPGGIVVVVRAAHNDLLRQVELERKQTETSTSNSIATESGSGIGTETPKPKVKPKSGTRKRTAKDEVYEFMRGFYEMHKQVASYTETLTKTQLPPATVSRWRTAWIAENPQT